MGSMAYLIRFKVQNLLVPMLMNKFSTEARAKIQGVKKTGESYGTPKQEAERSAYRLPIQGKQKIGQLCLPTLHFIAAITKAGSGFGVKGQGKKTYKSVLNGILLPKTEYVGLTDHKGHPLFDFKVNQIPVTVNNAKIIRSRPEVKEWCAELEILVLANEDQVEDEVLQKIIEHAGVVCGIGDYRQLYGKFRVVSFEKQTDIDIFKK